MSYTPPPPPEVPPNRPSVPSPLPAPEQPVYQQAPAAQSPYAYAADPSYPPGSGYTGYPPAPAPTVASSGCRWGCITALIMIFLVVGVSGALVLGAFTAGANGVGGIFGSIGNAIGNVLNSWAIALNPPKRYIILPQVERIQALGELTTVKFNYAGLVTVTQDMPGLLGALYGDQQVLVAVVSIRAGIDLKSITQEDIVYDEARNILLFRLPAPVLQECFLDDSKTYVVERNTGIFGGASPALDNQARAYAIQQFRDQALEESILQEAQGETRTVLEGFMGVLNPPSEAPNIEIFFQAPDPTAILPETCR